MDLETLRGVVPAGVIVTTRPHGHLVPIAAQLTGVPEVIAAIEDLGQRGIPTYVLELAPRPQTGPDGAPVWGLFLNGEDQ